MIVPTRRRARHLLRERLLSAGLAEVAPLPIQTLEGFAELLYLGLPAARRRASRSFRTFLFSRAVHETRLQLRFFTPRAREPYLFPGTLDRIVATLSALRDAGVFAGDLEEELSGTTSDDRLLLHDLRLVARQYEKGLEGRGVQDEAGIMHSLAEAIAAEDLGALLAARFPGCRSLLFDGFDEFSGLEFRLIRKLAGLHGLQLTIRLDCTEGHPELFGHLHPLIQRLQEAGFVKKGEDAAAPRPVDRLAPFLFLPPATTPRINHAGTIAVVRAPDRVHETEEICRIIKHAVVSGSIRDPNGICVALPQLDRYTDIIREAFQRYGIPANITDRFRLSRSPLVVDILSLLRLRSHNFMREDLLRAAGSPYFRFSSGKGIDAANLAAAAYRLRVTAGEEAWREAFRRREARLPSLASRTDDPEEFLAGEEASLRRASADFASVVESTLPLAGPHLPEEFRERLVKVLEMLRVPESIEETADPQVQEREARAYGVLLALVDSLVRFLQRGRVARPLGFYLEQLRLAIGRERFNIRERPGWGVLVTALEEIRGLRFDLLILPGMVDGEFPAAMQPDLFLDTGRRQEREQRHLARERYRFYQALAAWGGQLVLTSPERDAGVELVESPFLNAVQAVAEVRMESPAPRGAAFTPAEALARLPAEIPASLPVPDPLRPLAAEIRRVRLVEESRRATHALAHYEGVLAEGLSGRARARLSHLRDEVFSVSQLEEYGECPFRFLLTRLLRLRREDPVVEELTGLERGAAIHEVLFAFFLDRRTRGLPPIRTVSEMEFTRALDDMQRIARQALERLDIPDLFWEFEKERILGLAGRRKGLLQAVLEEERKRTDAVEPLYFEAAFGRGKRNDPADPRLTSPQPVPAGRLLLKGKIDRIDGNERCFTVIDYKTGAGIPSLDQIRSGASLQLPLYLLVAEQLLLSAGLRRAPAGGLYYQVRDPVRLRLGIGSAPWSGEAFPAARGRRRLMPAEAELRDVIRTAVRTAEHHVDAMTRGEFPLAPPAQMQRLCASCDFAAVCRLRTITQGFAYPMEEP